MAEDHIPLGPNLSRSPFDRGRSDQQKSPEERRLQESSEQVSGRLNTWETMLVMAGACSGAVALTTVALAVSAGFSGILVLCMIVPALVYTAILLGRCWNMVRHKWQHERHPYGAIGYEAFGDVGRSAINVMIVVSSFSFSAATLIVSAELLFLVSEETFRGMFCYLPLIFACLALPLTWLGTPKDIWQIGALALCSAALAVILLCIGLVVAFFDDTSSPNVTDSTSPPSTVQRRLSYPLLLMEICGTSLFALGGHALFPTVQQDMQKPEKYTRVTLLVFGYLTSSIILVTVVSYIFLPHDLLLTITSDANIINLLPRSLLTTIPALLYFVHHCTMIVTNNNPLFQYVEERLDIPKEFSWRRMLSRSTIIFLEVFVAESIPRFGLLATLVGGVVSPMLSLAAPCLCYLRLRSIETPDDFKKSKGIWMLETVVCWLISAFTPVIMIAIMYIAGSSITSGNTVFKVPCYVNATLAHE
ncbi:uncharacterized protein [Asterias amurensis]|uniref:uncharacterized protein n=1 Tax=Asterias amurensis TaxID=7602 RepID=UPI003AB80DA3